MGELELALRLLPRSLANEELLRLFEVSRQLAVKIGAYGKHRLIPFRCLISVAFRKMESRFDLLHQRLNGFFHTTILSQKGSRGLLVFIKQVETCYGDTRKHSKGQLKCLLQPEKNAGCVCWRTAGKSILSQHTECRESLSNSGEACQPSFPFVLTAMDLISLSNRMQM